MAIKPPSDILSDVAAAAHPARLREATQRLQQAGPDAAAAASEFTTALEAVSAAKTPVPPAPPPPAPAHKIAASNPAPAATRASPAPTDAKKEAFEKLEGYFLQTFVDSMLPKQAESVFGSGTAGDVWKSMLAEHIAAEIARSTKFGIAERMAGNHFGAAGRETGLLGSTGKTGPEKNLPYVQDKRAPEPVSLDKPTLSAARTIRS